jgi:riboflavin synthase
MFTGIIQAIGKVATLEHQGGDARLRIDVNKLDLSDVARGDSIAVSGVCLTAVDLNDRTFTADVSGETLACTTLGGLGVGDPVNLEKALTPTSRLGGHLVSGHVDGLGRVLTVEHAGRSRRVRIDAPASLAKYIAEKGSVCVDGVSLTVNAAQGSEFEINLVPHTLMETTLVDINSGQKVNLEVDMLARYLERLLQGEPSADPGSRITAEFLARYGFNG